MNDLVYECVNNCPICKANSKNQKTYKVPYFLPITGRKKIFKYINCQCQHIYLSNRPTISSLNDLYTPEFNDYYEFSQHIGKLSNFARQILLQNKLKQYLSFLSYKNKIKIVDIGSADGAHLIQLKNILGSKAELYAIDIYEGNKKFFEANQINFLNGRLEDLNINIKFDLVICNQVIEHVADVDIFLKELYKIGNSDTVFIIETPNTNSIDRRIFKKYWGGFHSPQHFNLFNQRLIKELFKKNKFQIKSIKYMPSTWNWCVSFINLGENLNSKLISSFGNLKNPLILMFFTVLDFLRILLKFKSSNMRVVVMKENYK